MLGVLEAAVIQAEQDVPHTMTRVFPLPYSVALVEALAFDSTRIGYF